MDSLYYDRLTGARVSQLEDIQPVIGRWLIDPPENGSVQLNTVAVEAGDFVVPDSSRRWRVHQNHLDLQKGAVPRYQEPEEIEANSIRNIGRHLNALMEADSSWSDWLNVVPLDPGMSKIIDVNSLDQLIEELLGALETVCMKPIAHLHVEEERVLVSRAKRVPMRATTYLASHTEDWVRPLIRGVQPRRILSEVRHDEMDIYENRVAARLVDNLVGYLSKRTQGIKKLLKLFQDKEDYSTSVEGTYLRQNRILQLWGESVDTNERRKCAESTLKLLDRLKYRVMGMMDSPLYREIPRRAYVAPTLRMTNVLSNDQNYRRVVSLWREWVNVGHKAETPSDKYREAQELCHGMDQFALLLVMRALEQLGYGIKMQNPEDPICRGGRWELEGHGAHVVCTWHRSGTVNVEIDEKGLSFIAIPADLGAAPTEEQIQAIIDGVQVSAGNVLGNKLVLYAGSPDDRRTNVPIEFKRRLHTVGNDPRTRVSRDVGFLPVSPWDIGSVERVGRALRWFLDSNRFDSYPRVIEVAPGMLETLGIKHVNGWIGVDEEGNKLSIRRPPQEHEWEHLNLKRHVEDATKEYQDAQSGYDALADQLRRAVRNGKTGTLNQQKKTAHIRVDQLEARLEATTQLNDQLVDARHKVNALLVCPACGAVADPLADFTVRDKGCFHCSCPNCKAWWATLLCSEGHRFGVLLPGDFVETGDDDRNRNSSWEERVYGSDLISLPARTPSGEWGFVCPDCGEITRVNKQL